ncbi:MAG: 1-acyl-sn-glycerol-3-phosphate acyltransferase [Lachnospiraceae bacterium]|nr:1-acyl-sn-glycerol-3-phosphate acyltransferase [Lachnospiraceae bacterium]
MIRFILTLIAVLVIFILSLPVYLIFLIFGLFSKTLKDKASLSVAKMFFSVVLFISGCKVSFMGEELIPSDTSVLYVGNHRSFFDVIITGTRLKFPSTYIAKKEFDKVPILNLWMHAIHCFMLDRSDIKAGLKMVLDAIEYVKTGGSIFVFPEGTRNTTNELLLPFKDGAFKISTKSGCPIVPVAISNTASVFEEHLPFIKKQKVIIHYLDPIYPSKLEKEELKNIGKLISERLSKALVEDRKLINN